MVYVESFELNGVQIKTTVVGSFLEDDDDYISAFFGPAYGNGTKVIGFDTEWVLLNKYRKTAEGGYFNPECATVHLCDGSSCLVIQLSSEPPFKICRSLHNFLSLPNYTFVGIGIKDKLAKLEKIYGIGCRTSVELGPLAATLFRMPCLSFCGVDDLSSVVNGFDLRHHRLPSTMYFDWDRYPLSRELAEVAAVNVYSYYAIGSRLFANKRVII